LGKFWGALERKIIVYFMAIQNINGKLVYFEVHYVVYLWPFGIFSPVLVCFTKKNLAALETIRSRSFDAKKSFIWDAKKLVEILNPKKNLKCVFPIRAKPDFLNISVGAAYILSDFRTTTKYFLDDLHGLGRMKIFKTFNLMRLVRIV
jgi:hypothetical protein